MRISKQSASFESPIGFIAVEGANGAGKGTYIKRLNEWLLQKNFEVVATREPGGTDIGASIRKILLESGPGALTPLSEVFLFAADRAHHVNSLIRPALRSKKCVVTDRYYYSTLAFQGFGRGLNLAELKEINRIAIQETPPDLVILLDIDPAVGLRRARARGDGGRDDFEAEELEFHARLRGGFLTLADELSDRFIVLDASRSPEEIFSESLPVLELWAEKLASVWGSK